MIDTIIFDLGGVLVDWDPKYLYRKLFKTEEAVSYFLKNICTSDWNELHDGGKKIDDGTAEKIAQFPHYKTEIEAFYGRWDEMVGGVIGGTEDILYFIKNNEKYNLLALTNWSAEKWPYALENFKFLECFDGIVVSGIENIKKPDPAIYQLILNRYEVEAANTIFIDDNLRNIKAANNEGINGIHFSSAENLKKDLLKWKIL